MLRVSIANFDCDLYVSTAQALAFTGPLIGRSVIFLFDDWGDGEEFAGQKKAFAEFLMAHPDISAEELPNYSWESRGFFLHRATSGPSWEQRIKPLSDPISA